jgi:hypothetical protein
MEAAEDEQALTFGRFCVPAQARMGAGAAIHARIVNWRIRLVAIGRCQGRCVNKVPPKTAGLVVESELEKVPFSTPRGCRFGGAAHLRRRLLGDYAGFSGWPNALTADGGTNAGSASVKTSRSKAQAHRRGSRFLNLGGGGLPFAGATTTIPLPLPGVAPAGPALFTGNPGGGNGGPGNGGPGNGGPNGNGGGAPGGTVTGPGAGGFGTPEGPVSPGTPQTPQQPPSGGSGGGQPPGTTPGNTNPNPPENPGGKGDGAGKGDGGDMSGGCDSGGTTKAFASPADQTSTYSADEPAPAEQSGDGYQSSDDSASADDPAPADQGYDGGGEAAGPQTAISPQTQSVSQDPVDPPQDPAPPDSALGAGPTQ